MISFNRKIKFKSPPQSDIVIFERTGSGRIKDLVLQDMQAYVIDSKLEEIFIGIKAAFNFIVYFMRIFFDRNESFHKSGRSFAGKLYLIYLLSCIKCFSPKVVVTLIDNHPIFSWLCGHYKDAEFMAIQNGARTKVEFRDLKEPWRIGHFFCFGEHEKDLYIDFGHKIDHYYPVGSLLGGYYRNNSKTANMPKYDICVVSGWRGDIGNGPDVQMTMESMKKMDLFVSRYIKEYNLKAAVIMRSEPDSSDRNIPVYGNEKEYYGNIYPNSVDLIDPNFKERNIYKVMDESSIIVSSGSTAPREAFGWGKKILYCDFTGTDLYNDYTSTILFKSYDYDLFKTRMDEIRLMPRDEYNAKTKDYASYLMDYDEKRPPHIFIRQKIEQYLK